jgi:2-dehydropantoate 2-reductase
MRIGVVGAGAIGSWLGAALARAGHDTILVARGAHGSAMRGAGVSVTGSEDYMAHPVVVEDPVDAGAPVDAVLLCVKAHDQLAAAPAVRALCGPQTPVVAAQNGIPWWYFHGVGGPLEGRRIEAVDPGGALSAAIAPARAIGLAVYLGASIVAPGVVATRPEAGLVIGEPDGSDSERCRAVAAALRSAGFPVRERRDIRVEVWTKLLGNASFNAISLLTRAPLGTIGRHDGARAVVGAAMREAISLAGQLGAAPRISVDERLAITARLGEHKPSTLQDLEAGKRLELDALLGAVVELADLAGEPAPTLRTLAALCDLTARVHGVR